MIRPRGAKAAKAAKAAQLREVLSEEDARFFEMMLKGEEMLRHDTVWTGGVAERITKMGAGIAEIYAAAAERVKKHDSEAASLSTPWLLRIPPDQMIEELQRRQHLNERVLAYHAEQVAIHAALAGKLQGLIESAQMASINRMLDVPKGLQHFIIRAHAMGLTTAAVKDIPAELLRGVVEALNSKLDPGVVDQMMELKSERPAPEEDLEALTEELRRAKAKREEHLKMDEELRELLAHLDRKMAVIEPVVPGGFEEGWDYARGPLPRDYWSTVQEFEVPYEWLYRPATPEDEAILDMALPDTESWEKLKEVDDVFRMEWIHGFRNKRSVIIRLKCSMARILNVKPEGIDDNHVKIWAFLLAARFMGADECDDMFGPDFFDGVVMPCPATGRGVVRELVAEYRPVDQP